MEAAIATVDSECTKDYVGISGKHLVFSSHPNLLTTGSSPHTRFSNNTVFQITPFF